MNITPTVTWLELTWTLISLIGVIYTILLFWRSAKDFLWVVKSRANGNSDLRKYISKTTMLIFLGGVITELSYFIIGIIAMTQTNETTTGGAKWSHITVSIIFIIAGLSEFVFAALIYHRRSYATEKLIERLSNEHS